MLLKIGRLLPAMGYGDQQIRDLQETVNRVECDAIVIGTPIDLSRLLTFPVPATRVRYELQEIGRPDLEHAIKNRMGDKLQFERVETTRILDERKAKKKKASWKDLALGDRVTIHWKMMDKPRKAYEVIVLPPRSEAGSDL